LRYAVYEIIELYNYGFTKKLEEINLMDGFTATTRLSTDLNSAAYLSEISAVWPNPRTEEEAGRVVNAAPKLLHKWLIICGASCLAAFRPSACWATTGALPWDQTLVTLQDILVGPVAHAAIALAFVGAGLLYAVGGYDKQAGRLAASGIGGCLALSAIRLLNFIFP
jgi:type IV secretory pathway VirB2 component (pilin)